jgi:hypothetical protein
LGGADDQSKAFCRLQISNCGWFKPMRLAQLFIERDFAGYPAGGKRQNDEMPLDPALRVARDGLPITGEADRLDYEAGLLHDFANHGLFEGFAKLDAATRQCVKTIRWSARPAHDQHVPIAEDRRADCEVRTRWISPRSFVVIHRFPPGFR